jgi:hypothetical protein
MREEVFLIQMSKHRGNYSLSLDIIQHCLGQACSVKTYELKVILPCFVGCKYLHWLDYADFKKCLGIVL